MTVSDGIQAVHRIADAARLSGFTASALRYYEQVGVLPPARRDAAGYRTYDDRDVERLRLVARAKDLGCTLEEITDLRRAWDDDRCGPVKQRLRSLVDAKIGVVEDHLVEQSAFAAQLRATAVALHARPADGPCDDECGCTSPAATTATGERCRAGCGCGTESTEPAGRSASEPARAVACSLSSEDRQARVASWRAVLARVAAREPLAGGVRLRLDPPVPLGRLAELVVAERACCPFLSFALVVDDRGTALEVTAPEGGHDVVAALFGVGE